VEAHRSGIIVQWYENRDDESSNIQLPDIGGSTPTINSTSEIPVDWQGTQRESVEDSPSPENEILGATEFDDLSATDETIRTFALWIGECSGLLGATREVTSLGNPGEIETMNPKRWTSEQGAGAGVPAEERLRVLEWLLPACGVTMVVED